TWGGAGEAKSSPPRPQKLKPYGLAGAPHFVGGGGWAGGGAGCAGGGGGALWVAVVGGRAGEPAMEATGVGLGGATVLGDIDAGVVSGVLDGVAGFSAALVVW